MTHCESLGIQYLAPGYLSVEVGTPFLFCLHWGFVQEPFAFPNRLSYCCLNFYSIIVCLHYWISTVYYLMKTILFVKDSFIQSYTVFFFPRRLQERERIGELGCPEVWGYSPRVKEPEWVPNFSYTTLTDVCLSI